MSAPDAHRAASLSPPRPEDGYRERLLAGMAQAIREHGSFHETTVAEVVRHARTSRRTFYAEFADREACFRALCADLSERHLAAIAAAASVEGPWTERVDRALGAYLAALAAEPIVARVCIQEMWSAGPEAVALAQRTNEHWARQIVALIDDARAADPSLGALSIEAATVITGGFRDLVLTALNRGDDVTALHAVGSDLVRRLVAP